MKSKIQAIYTASGKEYPTDDTTLYAIDFLSELIDENHSLEEPELFGFKAFDFSDYSKTCDTIEEAQSEYLEEAQEARTEYEEENESNYYELFDAIETLADKLESEDDFFFEYDGNEYRIIAENAIWDIYVEEIKNVVNDCYNLNFDKIPSWISVDVDWEQTARNAYSDGYGHTFSSYDGSELEINDHFVFRTN